MFATIKIGDKSVPMLSKASCNLYYKAIFSSDPIRLQTDLDATAGDSIEFAMQMGYVFAKAAEAQGDRSKMLNLNMDTYTDWLDQFETKDLLAALEPILRLYNGEAPDSKEKKAE